LSSRNAYPYTVAPSDIWNYPTRTLTERFTVIERSKGWVTGVSKIVDELRFVNAVLHLRGSGKGCIVIVPDDDIISQYTLTVVTAPTSGTAPVCFTDHNDATECYWTISAGATADIVTIDVGSSSVELFLRFVTKCSSVNAITLYLYGSNDRTTWTQLYSLVLSIGNSEVFYYATGYRYYKFSAYNSTTGDAYYYLASLEAYPASSLPCSRKFSNTVARIVVLGYKAYWQLLEVVSV